jgi:alpha-L-rhamnosidase
MYKLFVLIFTFCLSLGSSTGQENQVNKKLLTGSWTASWINCPDAPPRDYGVYHFRKTFILNNLPARFIVHASGDNRYRLFVNGKVVCSGPARSDLANWNFETVDLAPYLVKGQNIIAAQVWNMGVYAAVAQLSNQTAFVLQGDGDSENIVNTDKSWKVIKNISYQACSTDNSIRLKDYMVIGPGDQVDAAKYPWGWEQLNFNDQAWLVPNIIANPEPTGYGTDNQWTVVPRGIPLMEESQQRFSKVRRTSGMQVSDELLKGSQPLSIPANKSLSILIDQAENTVAYPELVVSGGKGSSVKITYGEALFDKNGQKGNRNEIEGRSLIGNYDIFIPDGGSKRHFRPLWFRGFRYIQMDIKTGAQPLTINDFYSTYTGYPFVPKASFTSNDQSLQKLWDIGWHTARLCAGETYFDCPYYEQLQYEGDTRIQSLISLYVTGDDRLMRKALLDFYHSRVAEGLTQGRYPSNRLQVISPFSLFWVSMVYDYWMHRKDDAFISQFIPAINGVLTWYERNIDTGKDMLGPMKWWNFVDWVDQFENGVAPGAIDGNSSVLTLQYVYTLKQAARLYDYFGKSCEKEKCQKLASDLSSGTYKQCFDKVKNEMADTPEKKSYSQHASIFAILSGTVSESETKQVMNKILNDQSLTQATFYYRFYLNRAMVQAGMADLYYSQLAPWRDMLKIGLTTFAEKPEPTRSDCHAWSSSPLYDFLATICGIMPDAPGFSSVRIAPALGELKQVSGTMPHPSGTIKVDLTRKGEDGISGEIILPESVKGIFIWKGNKVDLKGGKQKVEF